MFGQNKNMDPKNMDPNCMVSCAPICFMPMMPCMSGFIMWRSEHSTAWQCVPPIRLPLQVFTVTTSAMICVDRLSCIDRDGVCRSQ